jgi:cytochrome c
MIGAAFILVAFAATNAEAAGNAAQGKTDFGTCSVCHHTDKASGNGLGPNLFGVAGRKAGTAANFSYSPALKGSGITWSDDKLKAWITNPAALVPGNRMAFAGLSNPKQVDDVIAYLHTLK